MDSEPQEISIPFHRPWLMIKLILLWPISLMGPFMVVVTGMAALFDTWHMDMAGRLLVLIEAIVFGFCSRPMLSWVLFLQRCWTKKLPSIVITQDGIVDNASNCFFGLLRWQDIQKIYPSRLAWRFSRKRNHTKSNVIVIVPKDMKQLASRYPLWKSLMLKGDLAFGKKWAAILVRDISMSPRNLMQEINQFYITMSEIKNKRAYMRCR